jgi:hypothetical protein
MSWDKHFKDLAIEILVREFSEDFDKVDYAIFNGKKIVDLTPAAVEEILLSDVCMCTLHAEPSVLIKSSMWVRYLEDPIFSLDNLFDELFRQKN